MIENGYLCESLAAFPLRKTAFGGLIGRTAGRTLGGVAGRVAGRATKALRRPLVAPPVIGGLVGGLASGVGEIAERLNERMTTRRLPVGVASGPAGQTPRGLSHVVPRPGQHFLLSALQEFAGNRTTPTPE